MRTIATLTTLCFTYLIGLCTQTQPLQFNRNKKFKIIQLTDIHWESGLKGNQATIASIKKILDNEQPDLVVLTGDIVTSGNQKKGWKDVTAPMAEKKIQWIATLGNHDSEGDTPRKEIYQIIEALPYNLNTTTKINGKQTGDFCLPILSEKGIISAVLYFFDSHAYAKPNMPGYYDWIKAQQIEWYRKTSQGYTNKNNKLPVPSLAFFHIPLPEYKEVQQLETTIGHKKEDVSSPALNSGMFAAMVEQQDIMGVFVGHDHNNDFIGMLGNIALAYGRCSGNNAYGYLRLGARAIELEQGGFQFHTWIATPGKIKFEYSYPLGLPTDFNEEELLPPTSAPKKTEPGIGYIYLEGQAKTTKQINKLKQIKTGKLKNFSLSPAENTNHFAFQYNGYINIPKDGIYKFYILSDDGAVLYIDEQEVVNNDGSHGPKIKKGAIGLKKGLHKIAVNYFEDYMGNTLEVGISGLNIREGKIPDSMLFCE